MKLNSVIKKQLKSLAEEIPPVGAHVLFLEKNKLDGDTWIVGEVKRSMFVTQKRTSSTSYYSVESQKRISKKSYPYIDLVNGERITAGSFIILAI